MNAERALGLILTILVILFLVVLISHAKAEERWEHHRHHEGVGQEFMEQVFPRQPYEYYEPRQRCWYDHEGRLRCRWVK